MGCLLWIKIDAFFYVSLNDNIMKVKIPSIIENIGVVESFIDNAKEKLNFNDNVYGNILIAVTEAVNNAIVHGNKENKNKKVEISLLHSKNRISFLVTDEGGGFDDTKIPDPTNPKNTTKIKGRGVFLMKNLSDKIIFEGGGSKVQMVFNLF